MRIDYTPQLDFKDVLGGDRDFAKRASKLGFKNVETSIVFPLNNPQTKEMLEENLPKLKEMLQEQGIALGDTQVNQNQQQEDQKDPENSKVAIDEELLDNNELAVKNNVSDTEQVALLDAYI